MRWSFSVGPDSEAYDEKFLFWRLYGFSATKGRFVFFVFSFLPLRILCKVCYNY